MEPALDIKTASDQHEIAQAIAIDEAAVGSNERASYIKLVAERGDLNIAIVQNEVQAFSCLDQAYFFEKPFISLLIVKPEMRRRGLASSLLSYDRRKFPEVWTSTNRSNAAMRALLVKTGWHYCGELDGLDEGDPEQFFKSA
ncbi:hypothetical protein ABWH92_07225 [Ahrensia marina]|uniref:hypothetical protein n=1 Tax=Ahrensia marina TaxID=1514904 RepID=UPI0035D0A04C